MDRSCVIINQSINHLQALLLYQRTVNGNAAINLPGKEPHLQALHPTLLNISNTNITKKRTTAREASSGTPCTGI